jgi:hypothetical protein
MLYTPPQAPARVCGQMSHVFILGNYIGIYVLNMCIELYTFSFGAETHSYTYAKCISIKPIVLVYCSWRHFQKVEPVVAYFLLFIGTCCIIYIRYIYPGRDVVVY